MKKMFDSIYQKLDKEKTYTLTDNLKVEADPNYKILYFSLDNKYIKLGFIGDLLADNDSNTEYNFFSNDFEIDRLEKEFCEICNKFDDKDMGKKFDEYIISYEYEKFAFIDNKLEFDIKIKPHTKEETLKYLSLVDNCIKNEKDLSKKIIPNENLKYIEPEIIQTKTNKKSYEEEM